MTNNNLSRPEDLMLFLKRRVTRQLLLWILLHQGITECMKIGGEKIDKYQDLKREIGKLWGIRQQDVVWVVVGALGSESF